METCEAFDGRCADVGTGALIRSLIRVTNGLRHATEREVDFDALLPGSMKRCVRIECPLTCFTSESPEHLYKYILNRTR